MRTAKLFGATAEKEWEAIDVGELVLLESTDHSEALGIGFGEIDDLVAELKRIKAEHDAQANIVALSYEAQS